MLVNLLMIGHSIKVNRYHCNTDEVRSWIEELTFVDHPTNLWGTLSLF